MPFIRLAAIGGVLLVLAGSILGMACTGAQGERGPTGPQGLQGEPGPNMIVAMGVVSYIGTVERGYNVTSCVWSDTDIAYHIELTGITFGSWDYVVQVTPLNYAGATPFYADYADSLRVAFWYETLGRYDKANFSFIVLDTAP